MNVLPEIGATVNFKGDGGVTPVKIVDHFEHKAIYVIGTGLSMKTGWGYASSFEEIKKEVAKKWNIETEKNEK